MRRSSAQDVRSPRQAQCCLVSDVIPSAPLLGGEWPGEGCRRCLSESIPATNLAHLRPAERHLVLAQPHELLAIGVAEESPLAEEKITCQRVALHRRAL